MVAIGPVNFYIYGGLMALGVLVGFLVARLRAKLYQVTNSTVESIFLILIPSSVLGARAYHVLHYKAYYFNHPGEIFLLWQGGLGVFGALIAGISALAIYAKIKHYSFWQLTDLLLPSAAILQAIGRIGNFFNQEAFGPPTDLPWKVYIDPSRRPSSWQNHTSFHPLFLYEFLAMLAVFLILLLLERKGQKIGFASGVYFLLFGTIRFLTEFARFDTWQIQGVKVAQVLSLVAILLGLILLLRPKTK